MDRRAKKTEKAFIAALFVLLEKKELNKITIKELCEEADMNRSTFYLHYYDIYDLMDKTEQQFIDNIFDTISDQFLDLSDSVMQTFDHIKMNKDQYRILFSVDNGRRFVLKLFDALTGRHLPQVKKAFPEYNEDAAKNICMIYVGGAIALLYGWIVENDCEIEPKELLKTLNDIIDRVHELKYTIPQEGA